MRKVLMMVPILLMSTILLGACGDKNEGDTSKPNSPAEEKQLKDNKNVNESDSDDKSKQSTETDVEDQLDLSIGDTGTFVTVLGSYDMTLNKATLVDDEIEDEKSTLDLFIILDLTIKNIGDENLNLEDVILSMEITSNLEHTGATDHAHGFDTLEAFEGELEPGKEMSAQFMTIVDDTEQYYFRKMVGNIASGSSNQVIWSFSSDEAK